MQQFKAYPICPGRLFTFNYSLISQGVATADRCVCLFGTDFTPEPILMQASHLSRLGTIGTHLFPRCDLSAREDEDHRSDVQYPPDEEGQRSSTAPHCGQPGQADEQHRAQAKNNANNGQSAHMFDNCL